MKYCAHCSRLLNNCHDVLSREILAQCLLCAANGNLPGAREQLALIRKTTVAHADTILAAVGLPAYSKLITVKV